MSSADCAISFTNDVLQALRLAPVAGARRDTEKCQAKACVNKCHDRIASGRGTAAAPVLQVLIVFAQFEFAVRSDL